MTASVFAPSADPFEVAARMFEPPPVSPYSEDPVRWVGERLDQKVWSKQAEILESVRDHRRTAVRSGHGVGKSHVASLVACWWLDSHPPGEAFVVSCYTDDTEVLTRDGWKFFKDVRTGPDGDLFATRNMNTKAFEWQHAFRYYEAPWDGEVVDIKGRSVDLRVTPNHRMLVKWSDYRAGTSGEILKPAEKITQRGAELPALSKWDGEPSGTVKFGRYEWDTVTFASFLGAWIAEGSLGPARKYERKSARRSPVGANAPSGPIVLTQLPGTKGYEPYRELLTKMIGKEPCRNMGKDWVFSCSDLWHYLSQLGKAATKRVPTDVKNWGKAELKAFLHFYLLGDGWTQKSTNQKLTNQVAWRCVTVSKRLADDLQEIAQKVGLSATIKARQPRDAKIAGRPIKAENCRVGYYMSFNTSECRSVRPSRSHYTGNVYCVSVPNEVLYVRRGGSPVWCGNTAPTFAQVRAILWRYIRRNHKAASLPGRVNQTEWHINGEIVGYGRKPADHDESAFQGIHARYVLVLLDEACGIPSQLWVAADALTTNTDCRILAIGNPDSPASEFKKVCTPGSGWNTIGISAYDSPNLTGEDVPEPVRQALVSKEWVEEKRREWGEDNPLYRAKVLGEFSEDAANQVVRTSDLAACRIERDDEPEADELLPVELGVDVGGGGDETVIRERRGCRAGREWRAHTDRPEEIAPLVLAAIKETGATNVKIDSIGIGFGVIGELRNMAGRAHNANISAVNVAEKASRPDKFINLRAELWWEVARGLSERHGWDLSGMANADSTCAQLVEPRWDVDPQGRIRVEPKDEIRKRLGRSPDNADALLLAFYASSRTRMRWL